MKSLDVIDEMNVASPCKASWNAMTGDNRARLCAHCDKHVYNIAAMTSAEIHELIRETEGNFCGQLYRRRDGTVLTADCPVGAKAFSSGRLHRALTYGVLGLGFLTTGAFLKAATDNDLSWPPSGPGVTFSDWKEWAWRTLGFGPATSSTVSIPPPPTALPTGPSRSSASFMRLNRLNSVTGGVVCMPSYGRPTPESTTDTRSLDEQAEPIPALQPD